MARAAEGALTLLVVVLMAGCCCGYVVDTRADDPADNQLATATQQPPTATAVGVGSGRRFGWVISWLNERGPMGQLFANVIVAIFVLPPLGPFVCALLENCDTLKVRARTFLRALGDSVEPATSTSRGSRTISDEVSEVLLKLDAAYDRYSSP